MSEDFEVIPKHIAFILDGNRRFAKSLGDDPHKGHEYGFEKFKIILKKCKEYDIREVTFYAMSLQNFNRSKAEKLYLMKLFRKAFDELKNDERFGTQKDTRVCFIGKKEMFPQDIQQQMIDIEEETKNYTKYKINICMAYGGREEIVDAVKHIAMSVEEGEISSENIDEECVRNHLWIDSYPDFIIRTSGEVRTSNFLPWQSVYSEWMFPDCKWPEFDEKKLDECLAEYNRRNRRFGR